MRTDYVEIETREQLIALLREQKVLKHYAFQDIDFTEVCPDEADSPRFEDCLFLGGVLPERFSRLMGTDCLVFPALKVPYRVFGNKLYSPSCLYDAYRPGEPESYCDCFDHRVYRHYLSAGKRAVDIKETLARMLHDHAVSNALHDFLSEYDERSVVGIMGGHGLLRTDPMYRQVVSISKRLTEAGYLMISGGGPGAMEATHLGAWLAGRTGQEMDDALRCLAQAPSFRDELWLDTAFTVVRRYPQLRYVSLGIPTWLYGHEPSTPFATHIAKYFENSIREDGILTIAMGGIIYAPGSAGTMQEIFQDAVQNHYLSFGYASPMVFLGKNYWSREMPVYPLLNKLLQSGKYKNLLLSVFDSADEVIAEIVRFTDSSPSSCQNG